MCLEPEFFTTREIEFEKAKRSSYVSLKDVLAPNRFVMGDLLVAGLVERKEMRSTADLHGYKLTTKGRNLINSNCQHQLFIVHKSNKDKLIKMLSAN